jgi:hypothetical protein
VEQGDDAGQHGEAAVVLVELVDDLAHVQGGEGDHRGRHEPEQ